MAKEIPAESIDMEPRSVARTDSRLSRWLLCSFIFHLIFIFGLFFQEKFKTPASQKAQRVFHKIHRQQKESYPGQHFPDIKRRRHDEKNILSAIFFQRSGFI